MEMSSNERNLGIRNLSGESIDDALMFILQTVDDSKGKIRSCLECYQILRGRNFLGAGLLEAFT